MRLILVTCLIVIGSSLIQAEKANGQPEKSGVTKLDVIDLTESKTDDEAKHPEVQRKRDSGYPYNRPDRFTSRSRLQSNQSGQKGRIVFRNPGQISRPFVKYGPPSQDSQLNRPGTHDQHRDKPHHHYQQAHSNQQHSNNFHGHNHGLLQQEIPSPIRNYDFVEASPIASQNNQPFGSNTANYLPPRNQKLPAYATPDNFSPQQALQNSQSQSNLQSQSLVQSQGQISDAALFLAENAQAIQQLYGAPATNQEFAPHNDEFLEPNSNQVQNQNAQFHNGEQNSQRFQGPLPSYASGTLNAHETLEQIQSLEKDRLIVQLQQALAQSQSQNAELSGRYAQNQANLLHSQDSFSKFHGTTTQQTPTSFAPGNVPFSQSPFFPGTTVHPGFHFRYGQPTTSQPPTTTITPSVTPSVTPTTGVSTLRPVEGSKGDGTTQLGASVPPPAPPPGQPALPAGFPVYGGFVPTLLTGTNFLTNVPAYGSGTAFGTGTTSVQSGTSPTHFGIPIPTDQGSQKPASGVAGSVPSATTPSAIIPNRPVVPAIPIQPLHPVATPLHPVATPLHPIPSAVHPVTTPLQPVIPAAPPHVHPVQTPATVAGHPTYGLQPSGVINPLLYKPIKTVYPVYYYPNVAYQLQKSVVPTYPWSYAPSYSQVKPAQIWK